MRDHLEWKVIAACSSAGIMMGTLSLFGLTGGIELVLWTAVALVSAFAVARRTSARLFLHGLFIGLLCGAGNAAVQVLFFGLYVEHNPAAAAELRHFSGTLTPQLFLLLTAVPVGAVYGAVIGSLSAAAARFHHPK